MRFGARIRLTGDRLKSVFSEYFFLCKQNVYPITSFVNFSEKLIFLVNNS